MVCSLASLAARERLLLDERSEEEEDRSSHSVTRKYVPGSSSSSPCPRAAGQSEGTTVWIALREAYSPANMTCAAEPLDVFAKYRACLLVSCWSLLFGMVIFHVELNPEPP